MAIERVNSRLRHWFARFRRRTCVVSKALEMVDATSLPPTTSIEQRQNSPCHCFLNTLAGLRPACGQRNGPAVGSDGGGERPANFWWRMIP